MTDSRIFGYTSRLIENALDVSARRHNLITGNIANMDTIGYNPSDLDFNKTLDRLMAPAPPDELEKTHADHLSPDDGRSFSMNGEDTEDVDIHHLDSVDIDREMLHLAQNNIKYRTIVELKLRKSKITNYAIDEGGK